MQLKTSAAENRACHGDTISITCSAESVPSVTSFQLLENDTAILDTSGRWTKTVSTGVFIYKCLAKNLLGTRISASVTVIVNGKDHEKKCLLQVQFSMTGTYVYSNMYTVCVCIH